MFAEVMSGMSSASKGQPSPRSQLRSISMSVSGLLWPKRLDHRLVRSQIGPVQQIDAVGYCRENCQQAIANRAGLARQIDNQALPANPGDLPRQDGGRHEFQRYRPHLLAEPVQQLVTYGFSCFRSHVA